jgi:hypothetical protein
MDQLTLHSLCSLTFVVFPGLLQMEGMLLLQRLTRSTELWLFWLLTDASSLKNVGGYFRGELIGRKEDLTKGFK